jgi:hypothetical protein
MTPPDWFPPQSPPFPVGLHSWLAPVMAGISQGAETAWISPPIAPGIVPLPHVARLLRFSEGAPSTP